MASYSRKPATDHKKQVKNTKAKVQSYTKRVDRRKDIQSSDYGKICCKCDLYNPREDPVPETVECFSCTHTMKSAAMTDCGDCQNVLLMDNASNETESSSNAQGEYLVSRANFLHASAKPSQPPHAPQCAPNVLERRESGSWLGKS